jgi:DNA-directed RNA polymerase subunit RPC12/RpoP
MIIPCFRCGKKIDTPNASNADYIMAEDTKGQEIRESLVALKHNQSTLEKQGNKEEITDEEYDTIIVASYEEAERNLGEDLVKVVVKPVEVDVQKTGVICPDCYRGTDFVIWGVHKARVKKLKKK